jgi:mevalonate kinase
MVTASAPGKMVLFGDHAVVYHRPCLVTAVDIRYRVMMEQSANAIIEINTPELQQRGEVRQVAVEAINRLDAAATVFVEAAIAQVFQRYQQFAGLKIATDGPEISYGLGSSSAVTAATVAALLELLDIEAAPRDIFDLSYAAVLAVQGKGSGADLAAAVYGGTVHYVKGGKTLEQLPIDEPLPFLIGYSGAKVSTTNLIGQVAQLRKRQPSFINRIFDLMADIVKEARKAMVAGDWLTVGELATIHQGLLDSLGVNVSRLADLNYAARDAGALGAKLSGAGGGDCMFAVVDDASRSAVSAAINTHGLLVDIKTSVPGVVVEK